VKTGTGFTPPEKGREQSREGAPKPGKLPANEKGAGGKGELRVKSEQQSRPDAAGTSFLGERHGNLPEGIPEGRK
jgi:hypothetical protein